MIIDLYRIFRARRDREVAAKLALRFAQGQVFDRVTSPLLLVHIALWAVAAIAFLIAIGLAFASLATHWSIALPALIPGSLGVGAVYISWQLRAGLDRVREIAGDFGDRHIDALTRHGNFENQPLSGGAIESQRDLDPTL